MTTNATRPPRAPDAGREDDSLRPDSMAMSPGKRPAPDPSRERRRAPTSSASAHALAMLTRQPVFTAQVPRLHVGQRGADGSMLVDDRASDRRYRVYTPRLDSEFRAGHRAGLWYMRTLGDIEPAPRSPGFATPGAAVETLGSSPRSPHQSVNRGSHCRVIWS